ncbi:hypothetical protein [Parafrankia sp. EAN1pec]
MAAQPGWSAWGWVPDLRRPVNNTDPKLWLPAAFVELTQAV